MNSRLLYVLSFAHVCVVSETLLTDCISVYADFMHSPSLSVSDCGDDSDVTDLLQGNSSHSFAEDQVRPHAHTG